MPRSDFSDSRALKYVLLIALAMCVAHLLCACTPQRHAVVSASMAHEYSSPVVSSSIVLRLHVELLPDTCPGSSRPVWRIVPDSIQNSVCP